MTFPRIVGQAFSSCTPQVFVPLQEGAPDGFHGLDLEQIERSEASEPSGRKLAAVTPLQDTDASANVLMNGDPLARDPATGVDWFARNAAFRVPEEAHEVFCPIHRVMEPASSAHVH